MGGGGVMKIGPLGACKITAKGFRRGDPSLLSIVHHLTKRIQREGG